MKYLISINSGTKLKTCKFPNNLTFYSALIGGLQISLFNEDHQLLKDVVDVAHAQLLHDGHLDLEQELTASQLDDKVIYDVLMRAGERQETKPTKQIAQIQNLWLDKIGLLSKQELQKLP